MKREWDPTSLPILWWEGPRPNPGDGLETTTGRRYLILQVKAKRLECVVLPKGTPIEGKLFQWRWGKRKARK